MRSQQTIQRPTEVRGLGLFTGEEVSIRFKPASAGSGVQFVRVDTPAPVRIPAQVQHVGKRARRTSLQNGTAAVETIEHCMAALHGLGVDNVEIEIHGGELPGGDGSSLPFVHALRDAGLVSQDRAFEPLIIQDTIRVQDGDAELIASPGSPDELNIIYDLDYGPDGLLPRQIYAVRVTDTSFCDEIAPARTFLFEQEAEQFRALGLGKHLTYKDVLVIGPNGAIENEFRFANECVRHKILDLIGDLYLAGRAVRGKIYAYRSGHALNHELVRRLLEELESRELSARLSGPPALDIRRLQQILPHRPPFLMIDRVLSIEGDQRAIGIKNVSINESFFQGHYPGQPIMPGVLIIEAMAQLGGILLAQKLEHTGKVAVLLSMDHVKFRRPVVPGDQLVLEARTLRVKSRTGHVACSARVNQELAAEAEIKFMMVDAEPL
ncbi:MAG: UDP-3-O-acyl-N-acetylglucosamine deacetylase [Phycisphaerae bacterium]|nr:UDP-3-O-acyl-N-acetylglucosamine deacetylase [Phycisphaerae bacterium]